MFIGFIEAITVFKQWVFRVQWMVVGGLRETFGFPRELNTLQLRNRVDPKEFQAAISRPL